MDRRSKGRGVCVCVRALVSLIRPLALWGRSHVLKMRSVAELRQHQERIGGMCNGCNTAEEEERAFPSGSFGRGVLCAF